MSSLLVIVYLVILTGLALGGFISNAFIIAVVITEWVKSRSLNSSELLLLSLGMSNICTTVSMIAFIFFVQSEFILVNNLMSHVLHIFLNSSLLCRFWFTAWLCVFYCIKIVNSTHSFFLWCKQRILRLLPWILLASAAISTLSSLFAFQLVPVHCQSNTTTLNITDIVCEELMITVRPSYITFVLVIGSSCPLILVLFCSIGIIAFLFRHICQMTGKESSFRNSQTQGHFKAAGTVLFLVFLYLSLYIAQTLLTITNNERSMTLYTSLVVMGYALAQAAILVWVNPRLKKALLQMLPGRKP